MPAHIDASALPGRWLHSHEEDGASEKVFRPATYSFPPSRGRFGFGLGVDGTALRLGPGPTDRPTQARGHWHLDGDVLIIELPGETLRYAILGVTHDRLVVKK